MPITYKEYTKQCKLLPLLLAADGSATVTIRTGFADESGEWDAQFVSELAVRIEADKVSNILDLPPIAGLTRRDDLAYAVYSLLVSDGHIEAGAIS